MTYPSLAQIMEHVPTRPGVVAWLQENATRLTHGRLPIEPLDLRTVLDLGYHVPIGVIDEVDCDALLNWFEHAQVWFIGQMLLAEKTDGIDWCTAALAVTWTSWRDAIGAASGHDIESVASIVKVAIADDPSREALEGAVSAWNDLPLRQAPPPWVGHFYAALHDLLRARIAPPNQRSLLVGSCVMSCCVSSDGSRRSDEIAAAIIGCCK